jgi:hypothetical protein
LTTAAYNRVRVHGLYTDFADFYAAGLKTINDDGTEISLSVDGTSPYEKETSLNGEDQVVIQPLEDLEADAKGYQTAFPATFDAGDRVTKSYGFFVPFFNGDSYHGHVARVKCGAMKANQTQ